MAGYRGHDTSGLTDDGWLHTGDLGYVADGEVFLTGRLKELVISQGHKYHPEDIERAAAGVLGIAADSCIAFSKPGGRGEAVLLAEAGNGAGRDDVVAAIRGAIGEMIGTLPLDVVVVAPGSARRPRPARCAATRPQDLRGRRLHLTLQSSRSGPTGDGDAGLVGDDHQLGAVARRAGEQSADVGLGRGRAHDQLGGDLGVAEALGDQAQHLGLALGEAGDRLERRRRRGPAAGRTPRSTGG